MSLLFGVPAAVLLVSYIGIALDVGAIWPGDALVHESGQKTFVQTIFWLEHAVREIPIDVLLGMAVAGALLRFLRASDGVDQPRRRRLMVWTGSLTALLTIFIVTGAALNSGVRVVLEEFAQMHTRPGDPIGWGDHWDTHLLSRFALMLAALSLAGGHAALTGASARANEGETGRRLQTVSIGGFLLATLLFGPNLKPFLDGIHIGHQARELFTHLLVTLPLSVGAGLLALQAVSYRRPRMAPHFSIRSVPRVSWAASAGVVLIGLYLTVGFLVTAAYGRGQSSNPVALVLVHFFEHGLSYLFTPLWTAFLCAWLVGNASSRQST
jgi:hypothetical protein